MNMIPRQRGSVAAMAGVGALGAYIYSRPGRKSDQSTQSSSPPRNPQAQVKREFGLEGAGVGGNFVTGSTELKEPDRSNRNVQDNTQADSKMKTAAPTETPASSQSLFPKQSRDRESLQGYHDTKVASSQDHTELPTKSNQRSEPKASNRASQG